MRYLKEDTQVTVQIGPFLDATDGKTAETGLTINDTDVYISKNDGNFAAKSETTDPTSTGQGFYKCILNTTDTSTPGHLVLIVNVAGALPVWHEFTVVHANVYDSLFGAAAADYLQVDAYQLGGATQSATDLKDFADAGYDPGTNKVQGVVLTDTATDVTNQVSADVTAISGSAGAADNLEEVFDGDATGGPMNLTKLTISGDDAAGVVDIDNANAAGGAVTLNGHIGVEITGSGAEGVLVEGNTNGATICGFGGHGLSASSQGGGDYHGIYAEGASSDSANSGHGIKAVGGTSSTSGVGGHGIFADGGAGAGTDDGGHGIYADAGAAAGSGGSDGIFANGIGTGAGINATGESGGDGIHATGGVGIDVVATNTHGIEIAAAGGHGILSTGASNGHGIYALGDGSGSGIFASADQSSGTGDGIFAQSGDSSGNGIHAAGTNAGLYMYSDGNYGMRALSGSGVAAFFDGETYGIDVEGNYGDGIRTRSLGGNGSGIAATGNGTGSGLTATSGVGVAASAITATASGTGASHGFVATGADTGDGVVGVGSNNAGHGFAGTGGTGGNGARFTGGTGGDGLYATAGSGSGSGVYATGNDAGFKASGASYGIEALSASGSGHGIYVHVDGAPNSNSGIYIVGGSNDSGSSGPGIQAVGGTTTISGTGGSGFVATGGAGTGGDGGDGITATAGTGSSGSHGFSAIGYGTGAGLYSFGGGNGHGIEAEGGTGGGAGVYAVGGQVGGHGFRAVGSGDTGNTGHGIYSSGGSGDYTSGGHGFYAVGGDATSISGDGGAGIKALGGTGQDDDGSGINATGGVANGIGMELVGTGTGKDIDADEIDAIPTLSTTVDSTSLETIYEYVMAMVNAKYDLDTPNVGNVRFYKRDNATPLFDVDVTTGGRTRL